MADCFKIKLRSAGYRLVYRVDDDTVFVTVIAVGRRERDPVYRNAIARREQPANEPDQSHKGEKD